MRKINKIKIFANDNLVSQQIKSDLENLLSEYNFELNDEEYDLAIAIGGDGTFLRMIKNNSFNSNVYYIGINTGTLGFLQEIKPGNIKEFVISLNKNAFKVDNIGVLETLIKTEDSVSRYYSLNELVLRESELNLFGASIFVDSHKLENFYGDGLLISTSVGSSAYNTNFGGSFVYNTLHTIQITPIAAFNTKAYRNLINSIVLPEKLHVEIYPSKKTVLAIFDGENRRYDNVLKIECFVKNKKLKFLRMKEYNYIDIVHEKFLTD